MIFLFRLPKLYFSSKQIKEKRKIILSEETLKDESKKKKMKTQIKKEIKSLLCRFSHLRELYITFLVSILNIQK